MTFPLKSAGKVALVVVLLRGHGRFAIERDVLEGRKPGPLVAFPREIEFPAMTPETMHKFMFAWVNNGVIYRTFKPFGHGPSVYPIELCRNLIPFHQN